jgi:hypothetical protein
MRPAPEPERDRTSERTACSHCGRSLECCGFCEREDCGHAVCTSCMRVELRQALPVLHPHGG